MSADPNTIQASQEDLATGGDQNQSGQAEKTVDQLKSELEAVKAQNQKYSQALHTFTKRLDKFEAAARAVPDIDEHLTSNGAKPRQQSQAAPQEDQSLRERLERIEARERSQKEREKISAIKSALEQHDVDGQAASRLARLIAIEQADRIEVDDDLRVTVDDAGNPRAVSEWMRDYLQTDDGRLLIPAKRATRSNAAPAQTVSNPGVQKLSRMEYGKLTLEQLRSGRYEMES
jgi:hypothetical protein